MEQEYLYLQLKRENYIEIKDGNMTVKVGGRIITDSIENYVLSYFKINVGCSMCFILRNFDQDLSWEYDVFAGKKAQEEVKQFVEIMDKHGLFENRSRFDVVHNPTEREKAMIYKPVEKDKQKCPKCGGENYHAFVEEKVIREGETKKTVSLNLNPLKPFTVFEEKEKVVREPRVKHVSKFVCDDCGMIFKPRV